MNRLKILRVVLGEGDKLVEKGDGPIGGGRNMLLMQSTVSALRV